MKRPFSKILVNITPLFATLAISGCGPVFAVDNDTPKNIYVDTILASVPRGPAPQVVESGSGLSDPHCWKDVGTLYVGYAAEKLEKMAYAKLCKPAKCNCTVTMTQLEAANR